MQWIIGVDEVGRGPLAGPVSVGALALPATFNEWEKWEGLRDSKKLNQQKRQIWYERANDDIHVRFSVAHSSAQVIDEKGIAFAIRDAAARAITALSLEPHEAIIKLDRGIMAPEEWEQEQITKGDETVPAIALASIVAKVTRDEMMCDLEDEHPLYGFAQHKGYGTLLHRKAIRMHGMVRGVHRASFIH